MTERIIPLIICGGAGTRLWPASREGRPKQFLPLMGPHSTFQQTVLRVSDASLFGRPIIITSSSYRFLVADQLAATGVDADIVLEPARRDSGPALAAGTEFARRRNPGSIVVALAADHVMLDTDAFNTACKHAMDVARAGNIVTFGVRPQRPATEYGYIRPGQELKAGVFKVEAFIEKPTEAVARDYVAAGYLWNSGNFMFGAEAFLSEYRKFEPDSVGAIEASVAGAQKDLDFVILEPEGFKQATAKSVDYAVMERTRQAAVIPVSYPWSDVGSWNAVWELSQQDSSHNAVQGKAVLVDVKRSYIATDKPLIALLGVEDLIVVASEDAVLVTHRSRASELKQLIDRLKVVEPAVIEDHLKVHRPWGSYQSLDQGNRYQVKCIVVKPGKRLSLQKHNHRAEHWVVVRGTAEVTVGDVVKTVHENESTYIPIGVSHRLANPGRIDLELIEVQSGSYLGEDDIIRFDDDYHRS